MATNITNSSDSARDGHGRITGWTAHIIEQSGSNALIRPLSQYSGVPQRTVVA